MNAMRLLVLGCAVVSLTACDQIPSEPLPNPAAEGNPAPAPPPGAALEELQGVVEAVDDRFGLRQADRLVLLVYRDVDALLNVLDREVILRGTFQESGEFAVASLRLADDHGEDKMARVPPKRRVASRAPVKW